MNYACNSKISKKGKSKNKIILISLYEQGASHCSKIGFFLIFLCFTTFFLVVIFFTTFSMFCPKVQFCHIFHLLHQCAISALLWNFRAPRCFFNTYYVFYKLITPELISAETQLQLNQATQANNVLKHFKIQKMDSKFLTTFKNSFDLIASF